MVIDHLREIYRGVLLEDLRLAGQEAGLVLRSPPLCLYKVFWLRQNRLALRACDPVQHFVHGLLDTGIRLMKFASCLRGKLAEHITIPQSV
jgi:hypothetical protein